MTARHTTIATPLGDLLLLTDGPAVTGLYFPQHRYPPAGDSLGAASTGDDVAAAVTEQLAEYFDGRRSRFDLTLAPVGSAFDRAVWDLLCAIPFGHTTTYGDLAERLGNRNLAQRVGQSVGHNPISIVVPCHRVVGADGGLTGFAGGLHRKRFLLDLETPVGTHLF
jgi:methylated-DNA-[protein]-cysteine S-methyltransferase